MKLHENMSAIQIRLIMKQLGWSSKDGLTNDGWDEKYGYSLWFERWTWHGVRVGRICIHEHITFDSEEDIQKVTYKLANKCIDAYEQFVDEVPWQMADGSLEKDPIQTSYYKEALAKGENKQELISLLGALRNHVWGNN